MHHPSRSPDSGVLMPSDIWCLQFEHLPMSLEIPPPLSVILDRDFTLGPLSLFRDAGYIDSSG